MIAQIDEGYRRNGLGRTLARCASYAFFEGRPLTTRGRWINPIVLAQLALHRRLPRLRRVRRPLFIIGTGRSGTTILGVILSLHRQVGFLNEPAAMWYSILCRTDVLGSLGRLPGAYPLSAEDASPQVVRSAHRLFGAYLFWVRRRRLLDKSPEIVFRADFVRRIFPDSRFIVLVRDGYQVSRSIAEWNRRHSLRTGGEDFDWWGRGRKRWWLLLEQIVRPDPALGDLYEAAAGLTEPHQMAAVEWLLAMSRGAELARRAPDSVYLLRFEELVADPVGQLRRLLAFCELTDDAAVYRYARARLRPPAPHPRFSPSSGIRDRFFETLAGLGYPTA